MSDHYHPWLEAQGHSSFTWSVLGAIAARTTTLRLATGVTCPTVRYHPAIIAQAAATMGLISDGRFTLGVGAGERLNEHVVGQGFPSVRGRHERLREALEIIRLLWQGGYQSYEGRHLRLEGAAGLGHRRATGGAGGVADQPVDGHRLEGDERAAEPGELRRGERARRGEAHPCAVRRRSRPRGARAKVRSYVDAGFDHIVLQNAGPDPDGFLDFFATDLSGRLRALG